MEGSTVEELFSLRQTEATTAGSCTYGCTKKTFVSYQGNEAIGNVFISDPRGTRFIIRDCFIPYCRQL